MLLDRTSSRQKRSGKRQLSAFSQVKKCLHIFPPVLLRTFPCGPVSGERFFRHFQKEKKKGGGGGGENGAIGYVGTTDPRGTDVILRRQEGPPKRSEWGKAHVLQGLLTSGNPNGVKAQASHFQRGNVGPDSLDRQVRDVRRDKSGAEDGLTKPCRETARLGDAQCKQGPVMKLQQRTPRRRGQQPKLLNSPEDSLYYNQLNRTLDYQGSKRKPRKLGNKSLDVSQESEDLLLSPGRRQTVGLGQRLRCAQGGKQEEEGEEECCSQRAAGRFAMAAVAVLRNETLQAFLQISCRSPTTRAWAPLRVCSTRGLMRGPPQGGLSNSSTFGLPSKPQLSTHIQSSFSSHHELPLTPPADPSYPYDFSPVKMLPCSMQSTCPPTYVPAVSYAAQTPIPAAMPGFVTGASGLVHTDRQRASCPPKPGARYIPLCVSLPARGTSRSDHLVSPWGPPSASQLPEGACVLGHTDFAQYQTQIAALRAQPSPRWPRRGGAAGAGVANCQVVHLQRRARQEEAAHLPHPRLREGLRQNVAPEGAPAVALRGAAVRLQLALLREELHQVGRAAETPADSHGGEALRVSGLLQEVHEERPPGQTRQNAPEQKEQVPRQEPGAGEAGGPEERAVRLQAAPGPAPPGRHPRPRAESSAPAPLPRLSGAQRSAGVRIHCL
ncbi:unnamed protein product [Tetraodon nigroviridis]|uniref:(spotted green pufferfish) hypothetical protein n=1 Tax=Tetraodon nigroviridis TaxID=99883 RepID=Q4RNU1_TETNG|nr:unnamed protein product [Tetraodon nigroviridis]